MSLDLAFLLFLPCLAAVVVGSASLSRGLHVLGDELALLPGLLGLLTALGADSPEISSAVTALLAGQHDVGVGVVLGSNLFNLAALLGLSPFLAAGIPLKRAALIFNGAASVLVTMLAGLLILHVLAPGPCMILLGLVFGMYVLVLWLHAPESRRLPLPAGLSDRLARVVEEVHEHAREKDDEGVGRSQADAPRRGTGRLAFVLAGSLLLIVAGSMGLVQTTLRVASAWGLPTGIVGTLVLAVLTGIPNTYTSARLARRRKGAAVVSETLNSNTINIVIGIGLPALFFGVSGVHGTAVIELTWLLGLTSVAVVLAGARRGLDRAAGAAIIGIYLVFVITRILVY